MDYVYAVETGASSWLTHFLSRNIGLLCTKVLLGMHFACVMGGTLQFYHLLVFTLYSGSCDELSNRGLSHY